MVRHILIVNLHSAQNLGDDGIMAGTLAGLSRIYPHARITLAANDPDSWQKYSREIETLTVTGSLCTWVADCRLGHWRSGLWRMPVYLLLLAIYAVLFRFGRRPGLRDPQKQHLLQAYYNSDLILSCGGGNFYAHHSPSPGFFWALIALAFPLALGKPVVMLPQSVGPITGRFQRALSGFIFRRVDLIMIREARSARFLRETLGLRKKVYVLPDLAFGGRRTADRGPETGDRGQGTADGGRRTADRGPGTGDRGPGSVDDGRRTADGGLQMGGESAIRLGVTIMDRGAQLAGFANQEIYEQALLEVMLKVHYQYGAELHIFVQCFGPGPAQNDRPVSHRLAAGLEQQGAQVILHEQFQGAAQLQAAYAEMDLMIATRMHTGIFALSQGVPVVMIAYQPKAQGMMASLGLQDYCLDIATITPAGLLAATEKALENKDVLRLQINEHLRQIQTELAVWEQFLAEKAWTA